MNELLTGSLLFVTLILSVIPILIPIRFHTDADKITKTTYSLLKRCKGEQRCQNIRDQVSDEDMIVGAQICNCLVFLVLFIMIICCFPKNSKLAQNMNKVLSIILVLLLVAVAVLFNLNPSIKDASVDWGFGFMMASILSALITTILIYTRSSTAEFKPSSPIISHSDKYNYMTNITNIPHGQDYKVNKNYKDFLTYKKDEFNIPNNYNKTFSPYKEKNVLDSFDKAQGEYV